ncbi:MAG: tetratricopeptide repeat protein [Pseudomonadales bacterium]|nr:tetratricopeptide repeat protein [Pseudomonadales bacterium]
MKGYSTNDIAELLQLEPRVIRDIAHGIIDQDRAPGQPYRFSFQDIVLLRTAKDLLAAGVRRSRINATLFRLRSRLPANRPLTSLRISGDGGVVVIREDDQVYNPESGQYHFDFSLSELAGSVAPLARQAAEEAEHNDELCADDWYDLGVDLEAVSPDEAPTAYFRALELDPDHADAHVNLGRLFQEAGDFAAAERHYRHAVKVEPDNILAAFNLGTLLEETGRLQDAIRAYQNALAFADTHYNLSRLYELVGEHQRALEHLKTYRQLIDPA